MTLILGQESEPAAPSASKLLVYVGSDGILRAKKPDGSLVTLGGDGLARNALTNGTFLFAQRQAPGTLKTYGSFSGGRKYAADRWGITGENDSVQYRRVDTIAASESGLSSRYYAELKKLTSAGKIAFSQVLEAVDTAAYRGRSVRVQFKAKNSVGSHTLRLALLYLNSSGTADSIPAPFISAFGAVGVDPTWGTNLVAIAPTSGSANSTVAGSGLTSTLNSSWRQYGGVFAVPASAQNLVVVAFTDGQPAANDILHLGECALIDGVDERASIPTDVHDELERCQRFCWKTFAVDTAPAQSVGVPSGEFRFQAVTAGAAIQRSPSLRFPVRMRAAPTVTLYNPGAANAEARDVVAGANCSSTSALNVSDWGLGIHATGGVGSAAGNSFGVHILAEAEL